MSLQGIIKTTTLTFALLQVFLTATNLANASDSQTGGYVLGEKYIYAISTIDGWMADSRSGAGQGLQLVFYPKGQTWVDSDVVAYVRSVPNSRSGTLEQHVEDTVKKYISEGSPNYNNSGQSFLEMPDGSSARVYYYVGDQWGNYEAAVYFQEADTLNYLVFVGTKKSAFDQYLHDFLKIAATYENKYSIDSVSSIEEFENLKVSAKESRETEEGNKYHLEAVQANVQYIRDALDACVSVTNRDGDLYFHYFVNINEDGTIENANVYPLSDLGLCFNGFLSGAKFPNHEFGGYLLYMPMEVTNPP